MKIVPNLSGPMRVVYVVIGIALVAAPFVFAMNRPLGIAAAALGVLSMITAATGW